MRGSSLSKAPSTREVRLVTSDGSNINWQPHHINTCAYRQPKSFAFTYHHVYEVRLKVCAEPDASEPSITCTAGGYPWKQIYPEPEGAGS
jgi:hypothetical protein